MNVLAHLEAHLDFPDEDIAPDTHQQLAAKLERAMATITELQRTAREGQILRRGIRVAIIGRPNAGKSSLLNLLLGHDRAIVSPIAGTTRDTVEETASVRGIPVVFVDTAGLRESVDEVEREGVRRSQVAAAQADVLLHVLDAAEPLAPDDEKRLGEALVRPVIRVFNKADLPRRLLLPVETAGVAVSCRTAAGLEPLKDALERLVWAGRVSAEAVPVTVNARQAEALRRSEDGVRRALAALQDGASLEFVALELRIAVNAVGEMVGQTTTDDLLDAIFRQFCLGK
jgi:tRNA modification GTPase